MAFRISSKPMTDADCHRNHISRPWIDTDNESDTRNGLSVCDSLENLVRYFTGRPGEHSPGRGAILEGAYLVEIEGEASGDEAWEADCGESLIHPERIISCVPVVETNFIELLIERISSYRGFVAEDERCVHSSERDEFVIEKKCTECGGHGHDEDGEECWNCDGLVWLSVN